MSALPPRPQFLLDTNSHKTGDSSLPLSVVGVLGSLGRPRVVSVLSFNGGPRQVRSGQVVSDPWMGYLGDRDDVVLGDPGVVVSRIVDAGPVVDTRGLG